MKYFREMAVGIGLLLLLADVSFASEPADALAAENVVKPTGKSSEIDDSLFYAAIELGRWKAGSHVRYHNYYADLYGEYDRIARWLSLAVAVFVLGLPAIPIDPNRKINLGRWKDIPLRQKVLDYGANLSILSVVAAVFLNTYPFNDWRSEHTIAYQRWNSLKSQWDQLRLEFPLLKDDNDLKKVFRLQQEEAAIEDLEPIVSNQRVMLAFEELETTVINKQREFEDKMRQLAATDAQPVR